MKTNIKMRVTPEQSTKIQEICFNNGVKWNISLNKISHIDKPYLAIEPTIIFYKSTEVEYSSMPSLFQEIDAELFIRTNGTCEEGFEEQLSYSDGDLVTKRDKYLMIGIGKPYDIDILEKKLKKKNEILKKARIKRKNQREELHKLNLKLQKCISLEEHRKIVDQTAGYNKQLQEEVKNCKKLKFESEMYKGCMQEKDKEIEKLKVIIEYLEEKVK